MTKKLTKESTQPRKKSEVLHEKLKIVLPMGILKNWQKSAKKRYQKEQQALQKLWSFAWKIENRPTYEDFEKKNLDPQLHQIFKPITKFFCTFLPI